MSKLNEKLHVNVKSKKIEAENIFLIELSSVDGSELPVFSAGSHIDLYLPNGLIRQYSICNNPQEKDKYQIAVLRSSDSRGGSNAVHDLVNEGDTIFSSLPKNLFGLEEQAKKSLLIAGGIGITPIIAMADHLSSNNSLFEMHYSGRSFNKMAFLDRIKKSNYSDCVNFYSDDLGNRLNINEVLSKQEAETHLYVCGPSGFMNAVLDAARELGWSESYLHREFFEAEAVGHQDDDTDFEVELASSGQVIAIPKDVSVLQVLSQLGIDIPHSCEQGICGTCVTRVLQGEPEHRDLYLTAEEQAKNDQFIPCCSRSKSKRLVLEL